MRLLIVDDDPHIVRALMLLFEHAGHEVLTAHNGARGLEKLLAERPDVAIIDVMMPDMTGMDMVGSSPFNRGHEHQRSTRRWSAREGRPRCLGGVQRGGGT